MSACKQRPLPHWLSEVTSLVQVKKTCYAQTSQIRLIRKKMVEIMTREASACDLKELVGKFIPESIGAAAAPSASMSAVMCPGSHAHSSCGAP